MGAPLRSSGLVAQIGGLHLQTLFQPALHWPYGLFLLCLVPVLMRANGHGTAGLRLF